MIRKLTKKEIHDFSDLNIEGNSLDELELLSKEENISIDTLLQKRGKIGDNYIDPTDIVLTMMDVLKLDDITIEHLLLLFNAMAERYEGINPRPHNLNLRDYFTDDAIKHIGWIIESWDN